MVIGQQLKEQEIAAISRRRVTFMRCAGTIKKPSSRLYGRPCRKILAEPNSKGELKVKIKCSRCGFMNEV